MLTVGIVTIFCQVGIFDPYSDDPRLAVKKLCLCPVTGLLTVAGTAGQVVVAEFSDTKTEKEIPVRKVYVNSIILDFFLVLCLRRLRL